MPMACFDDCGCTCYAWEADTQFDQTVEAETRFGITLRQLLGSHHGWYSDGEEGRSNGDVRWLGLRAVSGVYIPWQQADSCPTHDSEHLRAYYVGKAGSSIEARLLIHQMSKNVNEVLTTEVSVWEAPNRKAKYVEQLLLDFYDFPLNESENPGVHPLCHHIGYADWN